MKIRMMLAAALAAGFALTVAAPESRAGMTGTFICGKRADVLFFLKKKLKQTRVFEGDVLSSPRWSTLEIFVGRRRAKGRGFSLVLTDTIKEHLQSCIVNAPGLDWSFAIGGKNPRPMPRMPKSVARVPDKCRPSDGLIISLREIYGLRPIARGRMITRPGDPAILTIFVGPNESWIMTETLLVAQRRSGGMTCLMFRGVFWHAPEARK